MSEFSFDADEEYLIIIKDKNGDIANISYNTTVINKYIDEISNIIQTRIYNIENGDISVVDKLYKYNRNKYKNVRNGILCEVSLSTLKKSMLFANTGPTIPLKLTYIGNIISNVRLDVKEYGINNVVVSIYVDFYIYQQASLPLTSKIKKLKITKLISVDLIKGKIPEYYGSMVK